MLFRIADAIAHPDHNVTTMWSDGARGLADLAPLIARGGLFAAQREPLRFVNRLSVQVRASAPVR
jgi:hypothetical protein